jgi:hypothetical protein
MSDLRVYLALFQEPRSASRPESECSHQVPAEWPLVPGGWRPVRESNHRAQPARWPAEPSPVRESFRELLRVQVVLADPFPQAGFGSLRLRSFPGREALRLLSRRWSLARSPLRPARERE